MNKFQPPTKEIRETALELTRAFLRLAGETDPDAAMKRYAQNTAQCVAAFAPVLEKFQHTPAAVVSPEVVDNYNELIMAVVRCFPGETRHQTALRYITQTEEREMTSSAVKPAEIAEGPSAAQVDEILGRPHYAAPDGAPPHHPDRGT